jgi:hypothetical protein
MEPFYLACVVVAADHFAKRYLEPRFEKIKFAISTHPTAQTPVFLAAVAAVGADANGFTVASVHR